MDVTTPRSIGGGLGPVSKYHPKMRLEEIHGN
jgi:hypothetical protein